MDKKEKLRAAIQQAEARLQAIEAREKEQERRSRIRRAIILGESIRAALEAGEVVELRGSPVPWLAERLTRPQDRLAWGL